MAKTAVNEKCKNALLTAARNATLVANEIGVAIYDTRATLSRQGHQARLEHLDKQLFYAVVDIVYKVMHLCSNYGPRKRR